MRTFTNIIINSNVFLGKIYINLDEPHLRNSWASSSFPWLKLLPMACIWEIIPTGDTGDFPWFAFNRRLSRAHVKHHSFVEPTKKINKWYITTIHFNIGF